ncbi:2-C-methyl-D-erythritol 4-phosphate cytidylyltransferase [Klenkia sp. LSe6-5]|uniref:2-C-methyl-D-erythritol 4-phosphate cytidylyltransferase n=1 Tax=Klenkia sesuvii TaxID=3103137 RepID=A0ABU8DXE1_9ACTN
MSTNPPHHFTAPGPATALVVAAGSGVRLGAVRAGSPVPKALVEVGGRPLVAHAVAGLLDAGVTDVVVAVPAEHRDAFAAVLPAEVALVPGGATRTGSVRNALARCADGAGPVLVHDAARPFTPAAVVARVLAALAAGARAVVPVLPVVDTTVEVDGDRVVAEVARAALRRVQTPQGFDRATLVAAYAAVTDQQVFTDDASVVRALGVPVHTVPGDELAAKITVPHDLVLAERHAVAR